MTDAPTSPDERSRSERCLSVREAADLLGVCEKTVRAQINRGHLTAYRLGRVYRIPEASLDALLHVPAAVDTDASRTTQREVHGEFARRARRLG